MEFCEDESNIIDRSSNASKIYNTRIEATVDVPGCTYYLYEENEQLARNQTGVFELKTMPGNNGDWPYIDTLSAGKRFYIRCVSPDGKETKEQILLKVYSPTLALHSDLIERIQKENFNILPGSISDLQNNLFLNILAGPGENKFKIKAIDSDIICKLDIEDKTLKLGINTEENFLDSQEAQNLYKNGVNKAWRNQGADEKTKKANEKAMNDTIKRWAKKKKSQYVIGALKAGVNFMGYGEFKLTDENAFAGTLYFAISGEYDANASLNFPPSFIPVPTYITIGSDGKLELKVIGPVNFEESDNVLDVLYELLDEYTADIGVSVEVGAGNSHTVKVGGKLRGGFEFQYNYKSTYYRLRANAKGSIEAKAFLWEWSFPLAETSWLLHDGYQKSGKTAKQIAPLRFEDIVNDANATLVTRDYLSLDSASTA